MPLTILAQGNSNGSGDGPLLVNTNWAQLAELALNVSIGQVSASELEQFINPAAYQAEAGQPEGAQIELDITGWTIFGTDYSQTVADKINQYWQQGQFTVNGESMRAWPGASQIAYGGNNTVTVQYLKGQLWILWVALAIAVAVWLYGLLQSLTGGQSWSLGVNTPSPPSKPPSWWSKASLGEKALIIGGVTVAVIFGIWFLSAKSIAEAGAPKIVVER